MLGFSPRNEDEEQCPLQGLGASTPAMKGETWSEHRGGQKGAFSQSNPALPGIQ